MDKINSNSIWKNTNGASKNVSTTSCVREIIIQKKIAKSIYDVSTKLNKNSNSTNTFANNAHIYEKILLIQDEPKKVSSRYEEKLHTIQ